MRTLLHPILLHWALLVLALAAAPAARAQGPEPRRAPPPEALERWKSLSPEERARLQERFGAWKRMDETQRAELRRRHERLRKTERDVRRELPPEARRCLEGLGLHEGRDLLREHLEEELVERGRRMRGLLPDELRARLETATPEERAELMHGMRERFQREGLRRGLAHVGRELGLAQAEIERDLALPPEAQRARLLELRRRELARRIEREGFPDWIAPADWAAWQALDDESFFDRLHAARPRRGPEGQRGGELWRLFRHDPSWYPELAELTPEARRDELDRRLAERLLAALVEHPEVVPPEELERLRTLPPAEVLARTRERLRGLGPPGRGGRGGPERPRGEGRGEGRRGERRGPGAVRPGGGR